MDGCDGTVFTLVLDKISRPHFKITTIINNKRINRAWEDSFAFPENLGSVPSAHMVAHNCLQLQGQIPMHIKKYTYVYAHTYIHDLNEVTGVKNGLDR